MTSTSPAVATAHHRIKAIVLIAISLAAIAVHGKATRSLNIAMPEKQAIISALLRPQED